MAKFSNRSINKLTHVHPLLVQLMHEAIKNTPVDFTITDGVRTAQEQKKLYAQGRITKGKRVTNCDGVKVKSKHQVKNDGYGYAVDLYPYFDGQVQVDHYRTVKCLTEIAEHVKNIAQQLNVKIEWGGDWRMRDYPHFELKI